jgi:arylsulfatase A-like enzyme/Tfp pilus assembly protein PilF
MGTRGRSLYADIAHNLVTFLSVFLLVNAAELFAAGPRPNVVVITLDTLRADHLGCYGYKQIQTPNIDALARSAVRFTRAYTAVPITLPSHAAIFTGSFPMATGIHDFSGNRLPSEAVTLAKVLRNHGYATAAFLGSAVLDSRFGLNQGFDTYFDHFNFSRVDEASLDQIERRGDRAMDEALGWVKRNPRQPFFLWVHLYDPHYPYTPPEPFASAYKSHPYDGEIAFDDTQVGRLLSFLREMERFSPALIVLTADHGEGLGEHGEKTHGFFLYNSTLHVPLIIKVPGASARLVEDEVSLVDIMPTVLQALRIPVPPTVQGRSLLSSILGRPDAGSSNLYAETYLPLLHFRWSQLRALQSRGVKYVDAPRPELYDTRIDPGESSSLIGTRQAIAQGMRDKLFALLRRYTPVSGAPADEKELTDPGLLERLRSLGYVAISAGTLASAGGEALPDPKDRIQVYELFWEAMADGQHGHYDESLRKLRAAERTEPNSLPICYLIGLNYLGKKDYPHALEAFRRTLELNPKFHLGAYQLGVAYAQVSNYPAAVESFGKALELDSSNFSAAFGLGAACLGMKRLDAASQAFRRAIEIKPDYAEAYVALGEIYLYQKRLDEAVRVLEQAVRLAPSLQEAHHRLGQAYEAKGLHAQAQEEFRRASSPENSHP